MTSTNPLSGLRGAAADAFKKDKIGNRAIVIFGHGHQPLRNILGSRTPHSLDIQPIVEASAYERSMFARLNWTEIIHEQCYNPLLLDSNGNSALKHICYDFTPSLLVQLNKFDPKYLRDLKTINDESAREHDGHGNAHATGFHHAILPLATETDKNIQISWGIEHFRHIYGRDPEGFWAPETSVDLATLSSLSSFGIKYVVLSPNQIKAIRDGSGWQNVHYADDAPIIPFGRPYKVKTSDGKEIGVFVFNPHISRKLAFSDMINNGDGRELANELDHQLYYYGSCLIASDIETWGHHKTNGINTLVNYLSRVPEFNHRLTNLGYLFEKAQENPEMFLEAELHSPSSWSCAHGVGRWTDDCGCAGNNPWRWPLRDAFEKLAEKADKLFEKTTHGLLRDPEGARQRYINVLLGKIGFGEFLNSEIHTDKNPTDSDKDRLSTVFNSLFPRQGMFVSCGWFFWGMGLETEICLGLASDLIRTLKPLDSELEIKFVKQLAKIKNSSGAKEQGRPHNAAEAYFNSKDEQKFWYNVWLKSR